MDFAEPKQNNASRLTGVSVLVVEDDYFIAKEVASILREHGATVLGPVPDASRGRALACDASPDCVVLDVNLKGHFVFDLAEELIERGVPSIFTTGYDVSFRPPNLGDAPWLQKPIDPHTLVELVHMNTRATLRKPT